MLETNTIPGMTRTSLLPQSAAAVGITFPMLLDRLLELALARGANARATAAASALGAAGRSLSPAVEARAEA